MAEETLLEPGGAPLDPPVTDEQYAEAVAWLRDLERREQEAAEAAAKAPKPQPMVGVRPEHEPAPTRTHVGDDIFPANSWRNP